MLLTVATGFVEASLDRLDRRYDGTAQSPLKVMTDLALKHQLLRVLSPLVYHCKCRTLDTSLATKVNMTKELQDA